MAGLAELQALLEAEEARESGMRAPDPLLALGRSSEIVQPDFDGPAPPRPPAPPAEGRTRAEVGGEPLTDPAYLSADSVRPARPTPPRGPAGLAAPEVARPRNPSPSSPGRKAHEVFSRLLGVAAGQEHGLGYGERVAREQATEKARFAQEQADVKTRNDQRPIGERIAAQTGFDPNMTVAEYRATIQGGGSKRSLQGLKGDQALTKLGTENVHGAHQAGLDRAQASKEGDADREAMLEGKRISARGKRRGGGGSGPVPGTVSEADYETFQSLEFGDTAGSPEEHAAQQRVLASLTKEQIRDLEARANRNRQMYKDDTKKFADIRSKTGAARTHLKNFNAMAGKLTDEQWAEALNDMKEGAPPEGSLGFQLQQDIMNAVGPIIRANSGANLTGLERSLYGGPLAPFLSNTIYEDQPNSSLASAALDLGRKKWLKQRISKEAILRQLGTMGTGVNVHLMESIGGANAPGIMFNDGGDAGRKRAAELVRGRFVSANPEFKGYRVGAQLASSGTTTLWNLKLTDPEGGVSYRKFRVMR